MKNELGVLAVLLCLGVAFASDTGNVSINLTVENSAPTIQSVTGPDPLDPESCDFASIGAVIVNVSDIDGYADVDVGASYVNISTYTSDTCVETTHGTDWVEMSCTGGEFHYYTAPGKYNVTAFTQDISHETDSMDGTQMDYNVGIHITVESGPLTFGGLPRGTTDSISSNTVAMNNCGNVELASTITGANITDGGSNFVPADQFKVGWGTLAYGVSLSESAVPLVDAGSAGGDKLQVASLWNLNGWVSIPLDQALAAYNTGEWTIISSEYE